MGSHPINLGVRFLLELAAYIALGIWGAAQASGLLAWVLAIGVPLTAAALWGTFAVPNDPSRGGKPLKTVPGWLRLTLELAFFSFGVVALYSTGHMTLSVILAVLVIVHYSVSYDRVQWLLAR